MLGAVKFEKDFAADLRALKEAVRLDLKEDFCLTACFGLGGTFLLGIANDSGDTDVCRGWLPRQLSERDGTSLSSRSVEDFRVRYEGVRGVLKFDTVLCAASNEAAKDGVVEAMLSLDTEREDNSAGSLSSSISAKSLSSSSSTSSAGSKRTSNGDL
jgi:hypothetical protein